MTTKHPGDEIRAFFAAKVNMMNFHIISAFFGYSILVSSELTSPPAKEISTQAVFHEF